MSRLRLGSVRLDSDAGGGGVGQELGREVGLEMWFGLWRFGFADRLSGSRCPGVMWVDGSVAVRFRFAVRSAV